MVWVNNHGEGGAEEQAIPKSNLRCRNERLNERRRQRWQQQAPKVPWLRGCVRTLFNGKTRFNHCTKFVMIRTKNHKVKNRSGSKEDRIRLRASHRTGNEPQRWVSKQVIYCGNLCTLQHTVDACARDQKHEGKAGIQRSGSGRM